MKSSAKKIVSEYEADKANSAARRLYVVWTTDKPRNAPENDAARLAVRHDLLWVLLIAGHIEKHEFWAGRKLQSDYASSLICPPKCALGKIHATSFVGSAREGLVEESVFAAIKRLAALSGRLSPETRAVLEATLCRYWTDDDRRWVTKGGQRSLSKIGPAMKAALGELAWATGYTTENLRRFRNV